MSCLLLSCDDVYHCRYLKKEAKRTDFAVTEAEEEAQLKAAAPPQSAAGKDKESEAKDDDGGFEGKQMSSWSAKEVNGHHALNY